MKLTIAKEHRDFFQKKGWIEFENLISSDQLLLVNQAINLVLSERLNLSLEKLSAVPPEQFYLKGHDLWRSNLTLQKFVMQPRLAEIASQLIEKKPLRLGYDQFFLGTSVDQYSQLSSNIYFRFLNQIATLENVSCLQGVLCGFVIALNEIEENSLNQELTDETTIHIFPKKLGHTIFFRPDVPIQWNSLFSFKEYRYYLIVYTQASAHYQLQPQDPHTHALKRLGYIFNDKLNDKLNPIVFR